MVNLARRERLTVRELIGRLGGGRGHLTFAGTPEQVADAIEPWYDDGAADGFNIMPPVLPSGLAAFRRRGGADPAGARPFPHRIQRAHPARHYGLPRPANRNTAGRVGVVAAPRSVTTSATGAALDADVLVLGGGPAGTWAAAATSGARVATWPVGATRS